jgi:uncharacterized protein
MEQPQSSDQKSVATPPKLHWGMDEKSFCLLLHLSQLAGMILPGAGLVLPIVMWATEKDNSPLIDEHGKVVFNWMISSLIYSLVSGVLCFFLIGIPILVVLVILMVIFPIIGGIKANDRIVWKYPLSISFFSTPGVR